MDSIKKPKAPKASKAKPMTSSQQSRKSERNSPESHEEYFYKKQPTTPKSKSVFRELIFITKLGSSSHNGKLYNMANTCNFDCTIMCLQALWRFSAIGKNFIQQQLSIYPDTQEIINVIELVASGRTDDGKMRWWFDVLKKPLQCRNKCIDMIGSATLISV